MTGRVPPMSERVSASRLALLAGLAALGALATNIMLPAFPDMAKALDVGPRDLAWTLSSFFIAFALGQLIVGPVTDAIGRSTPVLVGLGVFAVGSLVCALAPTLPVLIVGRVIQALGACATAVLARAIARDLYAGPALTHALSLVMIAMAAAPGFSPMLGAATTFWFGWRATFVLVLGAALLLAAHFLLRSGETLPQDLRRPLRPGHIVRTYRALLGDRRFIAPALTVSLMIGCLYTFFGAAPAILMAEVGLSAAGLSVFFAATVFLVFGSGLAGPRLARRWGAAKAGMAGVVIALAGGLGLLAGAEAMSPLPFMGAVTIFLLGMGLINPIGTAITLEPFGAHAGMASALLGFLQMACAAVGTALIGLLPFGPVTGCAIVIAGGCALATLMFAPVVLDGLKSTGTTH
ncbi:multidrug effflux MFS transporter [Brevundimonas sp. GCM10030266]|uniref:multidrug effflux MFS transporter n=1 Tax=Brevundimonas sp. GCM10030266 TaxID=3273386 RepID=UPI00361BBCB0